MKSLLPTHLLQRAARGGIALLLCPGLAACGASDDSSHASEEPTVQSATSNGFAETGTITATIDGTTHTWTTYRAPGSAPGTARWTMQLSPGWTGASTETGSAGLLGYSDGFNQEEQFEINFPFEVGQAQATLDLSRDAASVHYRPSGYRERHYRMTDGTLTVTRIDAREDGPSRFDGTFHGTLTSRDGTQTLAVAEGTFMTDEAGFEE